MITSLERWTKEGFVVGFCRKLRRNYKIFPIRLWDAFLFRTKNGVTFILPQCDFMLERNFNVEMLVVMLVLA